MTRKVRIAFGRIAQESNALSPVVSTLADFERTHLLRGDELIHAVSSRGYEARGFVKNAELSGFARACDEHGLEVELIPLISAWAVPGGPLSEQTHAGFRAELRQLLTDAGAVDGVFMSVHGAMNVVANPEAEADYFEDIRDVVGEDVPIAVTMDLHANLCPRKVDPLTVLCAYRTNPHRDHAKTGHKAGRILLDLIAGSTRPVTAWRSLPMVAGGGWTLDFLPPTRALFQRMKRWEKDPRVLSCSLFMSHPWLDQEEIGWATHVITDGDVDLAAEIADDLADRAWEVRKNLPPQAPTFAEVLPRIRSMWLRRTTGVIALCDASDVVGAGAPGDSTHLLREILDKGQGLVWYASVRDPEAVAQLKDQTVGSSVALEVGGSLDPASSQPLAVRGQLLSWSQTESFGDVATLDLGHLKLVVTEGANLVMKPRFFQDRGLSVMKADVCVVKSLFPFRLYFLPYARKSFYVRTKGATDLDVWRTHSYARPTWPQQDPEGWRSADRARRELTDRHAQS